MNVYRATSYNLETFELGLGKFDQQNFMSKVNPLSGKVFGMFWARQSVLSRSLDGLVRR
jgi:hypothetical protein